MHLTRRPNMTIYSYNFLQLAFKLQPWTQTTSFSITKVSKTKFPCAEINTEILVLIQSISGHRGNTLGRCLNPVPTQLDATLSRFVVKLYWFGWDVVNLLHSCLQGVMLWICDENKCTRRIFHMII